MSAKKGRVAAVHKRHQVALRIDTTPKIVGAVKANLKAAWTKVAGGLEKDPFYVRIAEAIDALPDLEPLLLCIPEVRVPVLDAFVAAGAKVPEDVWRALGIAHHAPSEKAAVAPEEYLSSDTTEPRPDWLGELEAVHVPGVGWVSECMSENTPIDDRYALLVGPSRNPDKLRARLWSEKTGTWGAVRAHWIGVVVGLDVVDKDDAARFREALARETKAR